MDVKAREGLARNGRRDCSPRQHAGHVSVRRRDARRAQRQCNLCLRPLGAAIPREEFDAGSWDALPHWERKRKVSGNSRAKAYRSFLQSARWREIRAIVLARDGGRCQGEGCTAPAVSVHHTRYSRILEDVQLCDLLASCADCNRREREQRLASGGRAHMERELARVLALKGKR